MTDLLDERCNGPCGLTVREIFALGFSVHNVIDNRTTFRHEQAPRGIWCSECYRQKSYGKKRAIGGYTGDQDEPHP